MLSIVSDTLTYSYSHETLGSNQRELKSTQRLIENILTFDIRWRTALIIWMVIAWWRQ